MNSPLFLLLSLPLFTAPILAQTLAVPVVAPAVVPAVVPAAVPVVVAGEVTPEAAEKLLRANSRVIVLDVRTPEEFGRGHIAGAVNISSADPEFDKKVGALDSTRPVLLHCASGGRSGRVLSRIEALRFPAIYHMNGGFNAWREAGKAVEK